MSFDKLGLNTDLLDAVEAQGYTKPTPIQTMAIPAVLTGSDIIAEASTGTGKTAAFTLPMLQMLQKGQGGRHPRALVLTPTRELAAQVEESVKTYGKGTNLSSVVLMGGVSIRPQISQLRQGADILVATPGRLLDHAGQKTVNLSHIEILVLDEADRMLDMGFIHDIRKIMKLLPENRQNMLFSATYTAEVKKLADSFLKSPKRLEAERVDPSKELIRQVVYPVEKTRKRELLTQLIKTGQWSQVLVFTRTKHGANKLAKQLAAEGVTAMAIHGNKSQSARTRALADFKAGSVRALVATDIAARGLDIDNLPHVVNYDLPNVPEDYVHRIGRTGRAGVHGVAVSLVCAEEREWLESIQKLLGRPIDQKHVDGVTQTLRFAAPSPRPPQRQGGGRRPAPEARRSGGGRAAPEPRRSGGHAEPEAKKKSGSLFSRLWGRGNSASRHS